MTPTAEKRPKAWPVLSRKTAGTSAYARNRLSFLLAHLPDGDFHRVESVPIPSHNIGIVGLIFLENGLP